MKMSIDKRRIGFSVPAGICMGSFAVLGFCEKHFETIPAKSFLFWLAYLAGIAAFSAVSYLILSICRESSGRTGSGLFAPVTDDRELRKVLLIGFAALFAIWFIELLGLYPGYFNYDADNQWDMFKNMQVTAHHPVLHTYLVGGLVSLSYHLFGTPEQGCFIYVLLQMLITDYAFTEIIRLLLKKKLPKFFAPATVVWAGIFPTVVINVMSVTKDALFAPFLILFLIRSIEALTESETFFKKPLLVTQWCVFAFFASVLRNNALYIMLPFCVFLAIYLRKHKAAFGLLGAVLAVILYLGPVTSRITVKGVNEREYLSVPAQQIMRVYHTKQDSLSEEERRSIEEAFDEEALNGYYPKIADVAKRCLKPELYEDGLSGFLALWAPLGAKYPQEYTDAFLIGNAGFWYPFMTLALMPNGDEGYYVCHSYPPVENKSLIGPIYSYYLHYEANSLVCSNPVTMWILAPATYFWIFFYAFLILWYKKKKEVLAFVPVLLIWMTFLLGPVALVRYVAFLYCLLPLEAGLVLAAVREKAPGKDKKETGN